MQVYGIKYGLRGFYDRASKPVHLTPEMVDGIQLKGGTILVRLTPTSCTASPRMCTRPACAGPEPHGCQEDLRLSPMMTQHPAVRNSLHSQTKPAIVRVSVRHRARRGAAQTFRRSCTGSSYGASTTCTSSAETVAMRCAAAFQW